LRVFNKKIILIVFLALLFFAGIIALTQENDESFFPKMEPKAAESLVDFSIKDFKRNREEWSKPAQWFRSNPAGMALEEMESRFKALRNEYALAINYVSEEEVPEYLSPYFNEGYYVEVRNLYKNGEQTRTQWIFRDETGNTRLNAVFLEPEPEPEHEPVKENSDDEQIAQIITDEETETAQVEAEEEMKTAQIKAEEKTETAQAEAEEEKEEEAVEEKVAIIKDIKSRRGFIELFDKKYFLRSEYRYYEDGKVERIEYVLRDDLLINAEYFVSIKDDSNFKTIYIDYYRYNRSLSLRNIERVFKDEMTDAPATVSFPRRIMDSVKAGLLIKERINLYPDFFGNVFVSDGYKMNFNIDDKGRILGQTLYDKENEIIWTINNTWNGNRIVSTVKREGETILAAEYAYDRDGERISERNIKNGVLERVVLIDGEKEIEELYMNNVVVLRAVWEDGRKISETRVRN
jgi:hypothetical protein